MAYKTNRLGIGLSLGHGTTWNILKTSKEYSVYKEFVIFQYIFHIYKFFITLPKKGVKTKKKSKEAKRFKIPILIGEMSFLNNYSKFYLHFNFFFDYNRLNESEIFSFYLKLFKCFFFLKKIVLKNFTIISQNLYKASLSFLPSLIELSVDPKDPILIEYAKVSDYSQKIGLYKSIVIGYSMHYFQRNRYFERVLYVFVASFLYQDCYLLSRIIAQELQNLRKHHKTFIRFIKKLSKFCFDVLGTAPTLKSNPTLNLDLVHGFRILFKGRLTLGTRQMRRKIKIWLIFGTLFFNRYITRISYGDSFAITRFGLVNIKIWMNTYIDKYNYYCLLDLGERLEKDKPRIKLEDTTLDPDNHFLIDTSNFIQFLRYLSVKKRSFGFNFLHIYYSYLLYKLYFKFILGYRALYKRKNKDKNHLKWRDNFLHSYNCYTSIIQNFFYYSSNLFSEQRHSKFIDYNLFEHHQAYRIANKYLNVNFLDFDTNEYTFFTEDNIKTFVMQSSVFLESKKLLSILDASYYVPTKWLAVLIQAESNLKFLRESLQNIKKKGNLNSIPFTKRKLLHKEFLNIQRHYTYVKNSWQFSIYYPFLNRKNQMFFLSQKYRAICLSHEFLEHYSSSNSSSNIMGTRSDYFSTNNTKWAYGIRY